MLSINEQFSLAEAKLPNDCNDIKDDTFIIRNYLGLMTDNDLFSSRRLMHVQSISSQLRKKEIHFQSAIFETNFSSTSRQRSFL